MKMKEPKYKGPRKGFSALWLVDTKADYALDGDYRYRLRIRDSRGVWEYFNLDWYYVDGNGDLQVDRGEIPCWFRSDKTATLDMINYDLNNGNKTVFLGYVKDTE